MKIIFTLYHFSLVSIYLCMIYPRPSLGELVLAEVEVLHAGAGLGVVLEQLVAEVAVVHLLAAHAARRHALLLLGRDGLHNSQCMSIVSAF